MYSFTLYRLCFWLLTQWSSHAKYCDSTKLDSAVNGKETMKTFTLFFTAATFNGKLLFLVFRYFFIYKPYFMRINTFSLATILPCGPRYNFKLHLCNMYILTNSSSMQ